MLNKLQLPLKNCLSCKGCCRFFEKNSTWRPKLRLQEKVFFNCNDYDEKSYLIVEDNVNDENSSFICKFLDISTNKCKIYDNRPFECQLYPLLLIKKENHFYLAIHLSCPEVQNIINSEEIQEYIKKAKEVLNGHEQMDFFKNNKDLFVEDNVFLKEEIKYLFEIF